MRSLPPPAAQPTLTVDRVHAAFTQIGATSGKGSQGRRADLVARLFAAATATEQTFLRGCCPESCVREHWPGS
ncbi:DNA ligase family protein [Mycobacterium xenopi 3993]|nr:DNA ligase family protein [Mycobacterium xenopi 3993]